MCFADERLLREAAVASGPNSPAGAVTSCQTAATAVTAPPHAATPVNPAAAAAVAALYSSGNHAAAAALFPQLCLQMMNYQKQVSVPCFLACF